jgi:enoyl-CoA hydratase/carnithine racemase
MNEHIDQERAGGILTIRFNRPEKKNALTADMYLALRDALGVGERDPLIRVIRFAGSGDAFSSGNDLQDFLRHPPQDMNSPVMQFLSALAAARKPIIAAVNGLAIGIGTTLLLHCDAVDAANCARFRLPFVSLALVPEAASSLLLPRVVGHLRAAELLMLGDMFDAHKAQTMGLVNAVHPADKLESKSLARGQRLSQQPPEALRLTKALLKQEPESVRARIEREAGYFIDRLGSDEAQEALQAFLEKRQPDFSRFV